MMKRRGGLDEAGFTLIELITAIIILGILTAIIAPRYFDMADKAESGAVEQAVAEAVVQFNLAYMKYVVDNKAPPADLAAISGEDFLDLTAGSVEVGDYTFTYTQSGDTVTVTAQLTDGTGTTGTRTIEWP